MNRKIFKSFVWFYGVVENIDDPMKLGRVKTRVIGWHTENKTLLPTGMLPWATVLQPTTSAANSGIGHSPTGLLNGSWVFGFFSDGDFGQYPVILASVAGVPDDRKNSSVGFSDPDEKFPRDDYIKESGVNFLSRGDSVEKTIVDKKKSDIDKNVPTASGKVWSEPKTPYNPKYPKNQVYETESGHIQEYDDTPGAERIHQYHKSGSFKEIHPKGDVVEKIVRDSYEIVLGSDYIHIKGDCVLTVDKDSNIYIKGDVNLKVDGDVKETIKGNVERTISGDLKETVSGDYTQEVSGKSAISSSMYSIDAQRIDLN